MVKAGKSTLLNALIGEEIAPTDAGECTRVVTWYRYADTPRVTVHPFVGEPRRLPVTRAAGRLVFDLGIRPEDVDRLVVDWPARLCVTHPDRHSRHGVTIGGRSPLARRGFSSQRARSRRWTRSFTRCATFTRRT